MKLISVVIGLCFAVLIVGDNVNVLPPPIPTIDFDSIPTQPQVQNPAIDELPLIDEMEIDEFLYPDDFDIDEEEFLEDIEILFEEFEIFEEMMEEMDITIFSTDYDYDDELDFEPIFFVFPDFYDNDEIIIPEPVVAPPDVIGRAQLGSGQSSNGEIVSNSPSSNEFSNKIGRNRDNIEEDEEENPGAFRADSDPKASSTKDNAPISSIKEGKSGLRGQTIVLDSVIVQPTQGEIIQIEETISNSTESERKLMIKRIITVCLIISIFLIIIIILLKLKKPDDKEDNYTFWNIIPKWKIGEKADDKEMKAFVQTNKNTY